MANKIILKKSSVASKTPVVGDLDYGELALNYADGKLFYKRSDNTIQQLGGGSGSGDVVGPSSSTNNNIVLFDGTTGKLLKDGGKVLPAGDVLGTTDTQTLTNKRLNPRTVSAGSTSGNLTVSGDTTDVYNAFGLTGAVTFLTPSGTPVDGQSLVIRIEDNGTARGITWTTSAGAFRAVGVTLPTTTTLSKVTYVGCMYNTNDGYWDVIAVLTQV